MVRDARIITLKDPNGNLIVPRTSSKAVTHGTTTLGDALETLQISKQDKFNEAQEKESVNDADLFPICDSLASSETKKVKFSNIKAKIKAYTDTLYNKTMLENNLTTETEGFALDAVQGKILDDKIIACVAKLSTICIPTISSGTGFALSASLPGRNLIDRLTIRLRLHEDVQQGATLDFNETGIKPILHANKEPISAWAKAGASINIEYNATDEAWYLLDNAVTDTVKTVPRPAGTILLLHFDENVRDETGNFVTIPENINYQDGKFDRGATISTTSKVIVLADSRFNFNRTLTIAFWIKRTQGIPSGKILAVMHRSIAAANDIRLTFDEAHFGVSAYNGSVTNDVGVIFPFTLPMGTWIHIAVTLDASTKRLTFFADGIKQGSETMPALATEKTGNMAIGNDVNGYNGGNMPFILDEFIWVDGQILWESNFSPPDKPYK